MKTLILTAHPSSLGFTHQIAQRYAEGAKKSEREVEIIDLYKTQWQQGFFSFENLRELPPDESRKFFQAKILEAKELVFIFPLWWMDAPAILKNFFDNNFQSRFAYRYVKGKPVGLLTGKTARVFITCDNSIWIYRLILMPFRTIWILGRLRFCGIKVKTFRLFDRMLFRSHQEKEVWLRQVYQDALR